MKEAEHIQDVRAYYNEAAQQEWSRLDTLYTRIEFLSTLSLIEKYLPNSGRIMDIGSGPGRYSLELLKRGFEVELLDLSSEELQIAKTKIESEGLSASAYHCESATALHQFEKEAYDGLLILGPMYHLHNEEDRHKVLTDAYDMLKPGGTALLAYINSWGALKCSVNEFPHSFEDIEHIDRYLSGNLKFSKEVSFTAAYFTTPPLAKAEIEKSPFSIVSYAGAEGFLSGTEASLKNVYNTHPVSYENYVKKAVESCEAPQYRDATEHVVFVIRK